MLAYVISSMHFLFLKFKEQIHKMYESKPMVVTGAPVPKNVE
jgi:hypothetical protein